MASDPALTDVRMLKLELDAAIEAILTSKNTTLWGRSFNVTDDSQLAQAVDYIRDGIVWPLFVELGLVDSVTTDPNQSTLDLGTT